MTKQANSKAFKLIISVITVALTLYSAGKAIRHAEDSYTQELAGMRHDPGERMQRFHRTDKDGLIAHGGGIGEFLYTNSTESIEDSLRRNFRFIEIDFQETLDHHLIGAHDWRHFHSISGNMGESAPLSLSQVQSRRIHQKYHAATAADLCDFIRCHPDFILVTDKINNFELLLREIPYPERMIVEVFSAQDYLRAMKAGILFPAFNVPNQASLKLACQHLFPIITISANLFLANVETMQSLHSQGICIMVYDTEEIDLPAFMNEHLGNTASMIYTGEIPPASKN